MPFQWSLHRVAADGGVEHREFLADGQADPRPAFIESLLAALGQAGQPIVVYSSFERRILDALGRIFPERAADLERVVSRLIDFLPLVRWHIYEQAFGPSFSLKSVAPVLVPGFGYDELGVRDGTEASAAFPSLARGMVDADAEEEVRRNLLAYCERDTDALVGLHRVLRAMADNRRGRDA